MRTYYYCYEDLYEVLGKDERARSLGTRHAYLAHRTRTEAPRIAIDWLSF